MSSVSVSAPVQWLHVERLLAFARTHPPVRNDVRIGVDATGRIAALTEGDAPRPGDTRIALARPGMLDAHSHAFQRGIAGRTDYGGGLDDFWSWREAMYRFVATLEPERLADVTAWAYAEALEAGITSVAEFHYVHHGPGGRPYADPAEMSRRVAAAAHETGIHLTLLPTLYQTATFGTPVRPEQSRFFHDTDAFLRVWDSLADLRRRDGGFDLGVSPHSVRAVPVEAIAQCVRHVHAAIPDAPVHLHAAEQPAEVSDCLAHTGHDPVTYLLDHLPVDARWTFVHATHTPHRVLERVFGAGAGVCVCPSTEMNLGDGAFSAGPACLLAHGTALGSDSHVTADPMEEIRLFDGVARLLCGRRRVPGTGTVGSVGRAWLDAVVRGAARAVPHAPLDPGVGHRADLVVLDDGHPLLAVEDSRLHDAMVFAARPGLVRDVMAGGRWVVKDGAHVDREKLLARFRRAVTESHDTP